MDFFMFFGKKPKKPFFGQKQKKSFFPCTTRLKRKKKEKVFFDKNPFFSVLYKKKTLLW
jgi:hypothetical protein